MLKTITAINYMGDAITMSLRNPGLSGIVVRSIGGLGPAKATINTMPLSSSDGSIFNSSRMGERNITFKISYLSDGKTSIETLRQRGYYYFPVKKNVTLIFETDNRIVAIDGYVESNEPDIFSQDVTSSISIICPNPYFYSAGPDAPQVTTFSGVAPMFEFYFDSPADYQIGEDGFPIGGRGLTSIAGVANYFCGNESGFESGISYLFNPNGNSTFKGIATSDFVLYTSYFDLKPGTYYIGTFGTMTSRLTFKDDTGSELPINDNSVVVGDRKIALGVRFVNGNYYNDSVGITLTNTVVSEYTDSIHYQKMIEFAQIESTRQKSIYYDGEDENGVTITIHAKEEITGDITIRNTETHEMMKIYADKLKSLTGKCLQALDELIICTVKGSKHVTLLRDGVMTNALNCIDRDSDWFQLGVGDNVFGYFVDGEDPTEKHSKINLDIENTVIYEGV